MTSKTEDVLGPNRHPRHCRPERPDRLRSSTSIAEITLFCGRPLQHSFPHDVLTPTCKETELAGNMDATLKAAVGIVRHEACLTSGWRLRAIALFRTPRSSRPRLSLPSTVESGVPE
jgi:hypothetical protein